MTDPSPTADRPKAYLSRARVIAWGLIIVANGLLVLGVLAEGRFARAVVPALRIVVPPPQNPEPATVPENPAAEPIEGRAEVAETPPNPLPDVVLYDAGFQRMAGTTAGATDSALAKTWRPETSPRKWEFIVLHHTATEVGSMAGIDAVHRQRHDSEGKPWRGIGYHFLIGNGHGMPDGQIEPSFRWREQSAGAHAGVRQYNEYGIGICLVGDFQKQPPTDAQVASVTQLVTWLRTEFHISADHILSHSAVRPTECPGRMFRCF